MKKFLEKVGVREVKIMTDTIDWDKVRDLRDEIGAEDFDEVVELFLEEVEDTLSQLGAPDRSMEHDLHFLKGSALNLGFSKFSDLCRDGETACAQGNTSDVDQGTIKTTYEASKADFVASLNMRLAS